MYKKYQYKLYPWNLINTGPVPRSRFNVLLFAPGTSKGPHCRGSEMASLAERTVRLHTVASRWHNHGVTQSRTHGEADKMAEHFRTVAEFRTLSWFIWSTPMRNFLRIIRAKSKAFPCDPRNSWPWQSLSIKSRLLNYTICAILYIDTGDVKVHPMNLADHGRLFAALLIWERDFKCTARL